VPKPPQSFDYEDLIPKNTFLQVWQLTWVLETLRRPYHSPPLHPPTVAGPSVRFDDGLQAGASSGVSFYPAHVLADVSVWLHREFVRLMQASGFTSLPVNPGRDLILREFAGKSRPHTYFPCKILTAREIAQTL
jgi:hypothetical protein